MRKVLFSLFILLIISASPIAATTEDAFKKVILELIETDIDEAVEKYYGQPREYEPQKISEITSLVQCKNCFEVEIKIKTIVGDIDQITFDIRNGDAVVIEYVHKDR